MSTKLSKAPIFVPARSGSGALAADSATLSDANYPLTGAVEPFGAAEKISTYWSAGGGTTHPMDSLDLQLLIRDAKAATPRWVEGQTRYGVPANSIVDFDTKKASAVYIRVVAVHAMLAPEDLVIQAATVTKD